MNYMMYQWRNIIFGWDGGWELGMAIGPGERVGISSQFPYPLGYIQHGMEKPGKAPKSCGCQINSVVLCPVNKVCNSSVPLFDKIWNRAETNVQCLVIILVVWPLRWVDFPASAPQSMSAGIAGIDGGMSIFTENFPLSRTPKALFLQPLQSSIRCAYTRQISTHHSQFHPPLPLLQEVNFTCGRVIGCWWIFHFEWSELLPQKQHKLQLHWKLSPHMSNSAKFSTCWSTVSHQGLGFWGW